MIPISMTSPWPALAAAVIVAGAGFAGGYAFKGRLDAAVIERLEGDIARIEAAHAEEKRAAAEAAAARLAAAQDAERRVARELQATKDRLAATKERLKEELYALPTAGRCGLSAPARGLLNDALAGNTLPQGAARSADAAAQPAADSGHDTGEADIGAWIADAIALHGECRARIDAIRQWDEVTHER